MRSLLSPSFITILPYATGEMSIPTAWYIALPHAQDSTWLQTEKSLLLQYNTLKPSTTHTNKLKLAELRVWHTDSTSLQTLGCRFCSQQVSSSCSFKRFAYLSIPRDKTDLLGLWHGQTTLRSTVAGLPSTHAAFPFHYASFLDIQGLVPLLWSCLSHKVNIKGYVQLQEKKSCKNSVSFSF